MPLPVVHTVKKEVTPELSLRFATYVKNAFCLALLECFANEATPIAYRCYKPTDPANDILTPTVTGPRDAARKSQVDIHREWPKRDLKFPCIVVSTAVGDTSVSTLGSEEGWEDIEPDTNLLLGKVYTGTMKIPVTFSIYAETPTDRDMITDLVMIFVRFVFRDKFYRESIPYLDITAGQNGEEERNGATIFLGEVTLQAQTEFDQYIDLSLLQAIESINLQALQFGTNAANMQSNNVSGGS